MRDSMNENEIKLKSNSILHKDNSLNRLDVSFLKIYCIKRIYKKRLTSLLDK